jgi:drug/metabolite transporter (DMT)-like permease
MPIPGIAVIFTFGYWIVAICWAAFIPHDPREWLDFRLLFALAFAIPTTIFLWTIAFVLWIKGSSLSSNRFIAIGVAAPVAYVGAFVSFVAYQDWRSEQDFRHWTDQLNAVTVDIADDVWIGFSPAPRCRKRHLLDL